MKTGLGLGAGIGAFGLLTDAARRAGDMVGSAIGAAMEDETSQAKLLTAIGANVKGWDGNTAAIEKVLAARMKLGFSDDEQRDSLATLVARTGNVTEALDIQRVAMDLARLKGIDLAAASKAIALGMSGQGRALKELGINVKELTTKQEVLGAIQDKAAGQADAWGNTTAGAFKAAQVAMDEASETLGYALLPVLKDLAIVARDNVIPAMNLAGDAVGAIWNLSGNWQIDAFKAKMAADAEAARLTGVEVNKAAAEWDTYGEMAAASREPSTIAAAAMGKAAGATDKLTSALDSARASWDILNGRIKANDEFANLPDKITVAAGEVATAQAELEAAIVTGNEVAIAAARIRLRDAKSELNALRTEWALLRVAMEKPVNVGAVNPRYGGERVVLDTGMPYVPYDNMPALLHRGEAVLTAPEAAVYRAGARPMQGVTAAQTIEVPVYLDGEVITRVVSRRLANERHR
jgi:hypothetical protein